MNGEFLSLETAEKLVKNEKNKEIERLKEEYVMLQNASDEVEEEKDKEIEEMKKRWEELYKIIDLAANGINNRENKEKE